MFCQAYFLMLYGPGFGIWMRYQKMGKGDWNASGERWTVRCADCQSMVPDLTQAVDGMNKRKNIWLYSTRCLHKSSWAESGPVLR